MPIDSVPALGILDARPIELGGLSGALDELRFSGDKSLLADAAGALCVVDEAISSVTRQRSRLAMFERDVLGIAWPHDEPPTVDVIDGPAIGVRCQPLVYAASFVDSGVADTHTASIDWGDGSPVEPGVVSEVGGSGTVTGSHAYAATGVYTVGLTVEDDHGGRTTVQKQVTVQTVAMLDDPNRPGQQALFVGGTPGSDRVALFQYRNAFVWVYVAAQRHRQHWGYRQHWALPADQRIYVYAGEGNDYVRLYANVSHDAVVFGGPGNDRLIGGRSQDQLSGGDGNDRLYGNSGNDILLGGDGNDRLYGHRGRDLLIGGSGRDYLSGSSGDDILVGGTTSHDANDAALAALLAECLPAAPGIFRPLDKRAAKRITRLLLLDHRWDDQFPH